MPYVKYMCDMCHQCHSCTWLIELMTLSSTCHKDLQDRNANSVGRLGVNGSLQAIPN